MLDRQLNRGRAPTAREPAFSLKHAGFLLHEFCSALALMPIENHKNLVRMVALANYNMIRVPVPFFANISEVANDQVRVFHEFSVMRGKHSTA